MRKEIYVSNQTGEVLEASEAIRQYYEIDGHGYLDSWLDEWEFLEYGEEERLTAADIAGAFRAAIRI